MLCVMSKKSFKFYIQKKLLILFLLLAFMGAGPASLSQLLLPIGFRSGVIYSWLFKYIQQHLTTALGTAHSKADPAW